MHLAPVNWAKFYHAFWGRFKRGHCITKVPTCNGSSCTNEYFSFKLSNILQPSVYILKFVNHLLTPVTLVVLLFAFNRLGVLQDTPESSLFVGLLWRGYTCSLGRLLFNTPRIASCVRKLITKRSAKWISTHVKCLYICQMNNTDHNHCVIAQYLITTAAVITHVRFKRVCNFYVCTLISNVSLYMFNRPSWC